MTINRNDPLVLATLNLARAGAIDSNMPLVEAIRTVEVLIRSGLQEKSLAAGR
jgi:hypothetical protein